MANTAPIYTGTPNPQFGSLDGSSGSPSPIKTQNTAMDGTGSNITLVFTAGTSGSYIQRLRFKAAGSNVGSVARVFLNNGSTNATASNNILFTEVTLPVTTANATAAIAMVEEPMNIAIPNGWKIYVTIGTTVAAGWYVTTVAGDY